MASGERVRTIVVSAPTVPGIRRRRASPSAVVFAVVVAAVVSACTESSTSAVTTAPDSAAKCSVTVTGPPAMGADGGTASASVTTQPECAWTASTAANWISGFSPASSQGSGTFSFRIAPNDGAAAREADIAINDTRVRISQRAPCRFEVTPSSQNISADGGSSSLTVATANDCAWTAEADSSWISLAPPLSGTGNGTVNFTVAPNAGAARVGSIALGNQRAMVNQGSTASSTCTFSISSTSQNVAAAGGAGTPVAVSAQPGCQWSASSGVAWITITSGASGNGNGSVAFTVAANSGGSRTGTLTIAGRSLVVTQAAASSPQPPAPAPCSYSIAPNDLNIGTNGGNGTIAVTAGATCGWTAVSNVSWITVTGGGSGTGNGSVTFTVAANSGASRTGTLTVAGRTFTVTQAAAPAPAPCSYSVEPGNLKIDPNGGTGTFTVITGPTCTWTAVSNASWITVTGGASGTGNGTVTISVPRNDDKDRKGTLTIAGKTVTVEQKDR